MILLILSIIAALGRNIISALKQYKAEVMVIRHRNLVNKKDRLKKLKEVEESIKEAAEIFGLDADGTDIDTRDLLKMASQVRSHVTETYEEVREVVRASRLSRLCRNTVRRIIKIASHRVARLIRVLNRPLQVAFIRQVQLGGEADDESNSHI